MHAAITASVLVVLIAIAVFAYVRVVRSEKLARERLTETQKAEKSARKEADRVTATYEFLQRMLARFDPPGAWGTEVIFRESMDNAAKEASLDDSISGISTKFGDQPEVEAAIRMTTGCIYLTLGEVNSAEIQFSHALEIRRRVLGPEHPQTLESMVNLAAALARKRKVELAEPMLRHAVEIQRRVLGDEHPDTLVTMNNLGIVLQKWERFDEAEKELRKCLEIERRVLGEEHRNTINSMVSLANTLAESGKLEEAEEMLREANTAQEGVEGGWTRPDTFNTKASIHNNLNNSSYGEGRIL